MRKLLFIEDNPSLGYFLRNIKINDHKYRFHSVRNSLGAIEWIKEGNLPYAILSDLSDNLILDFLSYRNASGLLRTVPFILLLDRKDQEKNDLGIGVGYEAFDGIVYKPFDPVEMLNTVESIVNRKHQHLTNYSYAK